MKNSKINNKNLVATSIAAAILVITGSTPVIGATAVTDATTPTPNRVNNEEVIIAQCPWWWPWCLFRSPGAPEQAAYQENGRAAAIAPSNKHTLI